MSRETEQILRDSRRSYIASTSLLRQEAVAVCVHDLFAVFLGEGTALWQYKDKTSDEGNR